MIGTKCIGQNNQLHKEQASLIGTKLNKHSTPLLKEWQACIYCWHRAWGINNQLENKQASMFDIELNGCNNQI